MPTNNFAILSDTTLHYRTIGLGSDRPALVLIHAAVADLRMWDDQFDTFAEHYQVIRYDMRGYGQSPNPAGSYSHHENLRELLDYLGIDRVTLVGCSMGGNVAVDFTLAYPERVTALATVGSGLAGFEGSDRDVIKERWAETDALYESGDLEPCAELVTRMWFDGPYRSPDQVDPAVRAKAYEMVLHLLGIPDELDEGEEVWLQPPALERLNEIRVPALALVGDKDFANQVEFAYHMAEHVFGAQLAVMTDVAHLPNMEKPEAFNRILLEFLRA